MTGYNGADGQVAVTYTITGAEFPGSVLGLKYELLVNGTWADITADVYQRDDTHIESRGRPNETTQVSPAECTLTLDNRAGDYTPSNSGGRFYPYLGRNTQLRISVVAESSASVVYAGYRFWGEVSAWPSQWDPSGTDIYVQISAGGVLRRYVQGGNIGSALKRFYLLKTDATTPVALWMAEDLNGSTQLVSALQSGFPMTWTGTPQLSSDTSFEGTDPLPLLNGAVMSGITGSYSSAGPDTFATPGTYKWTCPGAVTSLTSAECWGAGGGAANGYQNNVYGGAGGGGGEYAKETSVTVTPGNVYNVIVGAGGTGGNLVYPHPVPSSGTNGDYSAFSGDSVTVKANGGGGGSYATYPSGKGAGGTGSTNTTHHDGGAGGQGDNGGHYGGSGGGGSAGTAAAGNAGSNGGSSNNGAAGGAAVTGGGAGSAGAPGGANKDFGGAAGKVPGGGGGAGGENSNNSAAHSGGAGGGGQVKLSYTSSTTPNNVVVRFALSVPAAGAVDGSALVQALIASGSLTKIECYYGLSGGKLGFRGFNGATKKFDSGLLAFSVNGTPMIVSLELAKSGSNLAWTIQAATPGASVALTPSGYTGTFTSATIGAVDEIIVNPGGTVTDSAAGAVVLQYAYEDLIASGLADALNGHDGELAGNRFTRLCAEAGIGGVVTGSALDTPQMGPQRNDKFTSVLQTIEDAGQGLLIEARDMLGLYYRTRASLSNQSAPLQLDYSAAVFADSLEPVPDDALTRNDVTVTRLNGASATVQQLSGALSMQDPPNGVGDYPYALTAVLNNDTQVQPLAGFVLGKGTVDENRYQSVVLDMTRSEVASLFASIPALDGGDHFQMINMPSYGDVSTVDQLAWGFDETLNAFKWRIALNAVPESPYETALNGNILRDSTSSTGWSGFNGTFTVTSSPPGGAPYPYAGKYVNNGSSAGALEESGAAFAAASSTDYRADAWVYSSVTSVQFGFDWQDSGGSYLSTTTQTFTVTANTWTKLNTTQTSDASAAFGYARIGSASLSCTIYAQAVVVLLPSGMW